MSTWPSRRASQVLLALQRIGWVTKRQSGSHRTLSRPGWPDFVFAFHALGFVEVRQRGAHKQYRHPDGRATTVPFHAARDVSPTLLRKIAKDVGLTAEQLLGRA